MTRVCLLGSADVELRYELVSRETAREALSTYDLAEPFENSVAVETVSLGAAVSLLNDLNWYLVRFVDEAMVLDPSISETEWLSRDLARAIRDDEVDPADSDRYLKVYGVIEPGTSTAGTDRPADQESPVGASDPSSRSSDGVQGSTVEPGVTSEADAEPPDQSGDGTAGPDRPRLVEPMFLARTGRELPSYDLREVDDTLLVRVTEAEFGA